MLFARTRHAARTRYLSALGIVAVVAVAQFIVLVNQNAAFRKQTQVVDIAGRQRMLAVQIAAFAVQFVETGNAEQRRALRVRLRRDLDEFSNDRRWLAANSDIGRRRWPAEVGRLLPGPAHDVAQSTLGFVRHGVSLVAAPAARRPKANADVAYLLATSGGLALAYDTLVQAYVVASERRYRHLLVYEALGLAALLVTLGLQIPLIMLPVQRALNDGYRRLGREASALRRAQQIARLGSWERNLVTGEGSWSQQMREIAGMRNGEPAPPFGSSNHPDDAAALERAVLRARLEHIPYSVEHRAARRCGSSTRANSSTQRTERRSPSWEPLSTSASGSRRSKKRNIARTSTPLPICRTGYC